MRKNSREPAKPAPARRPSESEPGRARQLLARHWWAVVAAVAVTACVVWLAFGRTPALDAGRIAAAYGTSGREAGVEIAYPRNHSVFPPEIVPPTFRWDDTQPDSDGWLVRLEFSDGLPPLDFVTDQRQWTPSDSAWKSIKQRSTEKEATATVVGVNRRRQDDILSAGSVAISTSKDAVGAPIFYREVNLPFEEAVKDPAAHIRWRFGPISSKTRPPVVLDKLPVCGNCHSFSAGGTAMGMDVDYGSDHGSYVISPVSSKMVFDRKKIITWGDFEPDVNQGTFGLLSQISPDGRYVLSTVKDRSVFMPVDNLEFSQLFFPVQGILAYYNRSTKSFHSLAGADDERYVQSNPTWSPDGKYVVFARAEAYHSDSLRDQGRRLLKGEDVPFADGKTPFKFDLWRVPFNGGKGGQAEPLEGASNNGMSNYFAKYSPDGKWIVFCKAQNYMLLQPDSQLYIIPAEGGEARRLECNTRRMNSWHSWSPNGKWLVFSSKAYSPYTQLFLTHIDEQGRSTPPVVLSQFTASDMAANIPEFVNAPADAIKEIDDEFVDKSLYLEAGSYNLYDGDYEMALANIQKSLELDPDNADAYSSWAVVLMVQGKLEEARQKVAKALALDPRQKDAYCTLGQILRGQGDLEGSVAALEKSLEIDPQFASGHAQLGATLMDMGRDQEGREHLQRALAIEPDNSFAHRRLGIEARRAGDDAEAAEMFRQALEKDPDSVSALLRMAVLLATTSDPALKDPDRAVKIAAHACDLTKQRDPTALITLSEVLAAAGRFSEAVSMAKKGLQVAKEKGDSEIISAFKVRIELYEKQAAAPGSG